MSTDLQRELKRMADAGEAAASQVDAGPLRAAARRRRSVRAVATLTAGAGAVAAVAVAGSALISPQTLTPADVGSSPSADAPTVMSVTASDGFACGQPAPKILDPEGDEDLHLEVSGGPAAAAGPALPPLDGVSAPSDTPIAIESTIVNGTDVDLDITLPAHPSFRGFAVQDGVVVGTLTPATPVDRLPDREVPLPGGSDLRERSASDWLLACSPANSPSPLGPGVYQLFIEQPVWGATSISASGPTARIASGPHSVTILPPP
jgi:hypothetical protein